MARQNHQEASARKKAQLSTDLVIVSAALLAAFLFLFSIIDSRNDELIGAHGYLSAKDIADKSAWNINQAFIGGEGARMSFYLPESLGDNSNYELEIRPDARIVEIRWKTRHYTAPVITARVSGTLELAKGRVNITNQNGRVQVEQ